ncbi:MAG: hypothetical protein IKH26_12685 [Bacteroidaceae bacterium]|nr:hypothetical protein [Bacteroidaceae bacterium]
MEKAIEGVPADMSAREWKKGNCPTNPEKKSRWGKYLAIPIPFIRLLVTQPEKTDSVITYCLYEATIRMDPYPTDVLTQVVYEYVRHVRGQKSELPEEIINFIDDLVEDAKFGIDEDYMGFDSKGHFDPAEEVEQLGAYMHIRDPVYAIAREWFCVRRTWNSYDLQIPDFKRVRAVHNEYAAFHFPWKPFAWCKFDNLLKYLKRYNSGELTELERVVFAMYLALKSIKGEKAYTHATESWIWARTFGVNKEADFQREILENPKRAKAAELYRKYSTRRMFDKLRKLLVKWEFVRSCFGKQGRGTFFSCFYDEKDLRRILDYKKL